MNLLRIAFWDLKRVLKDWQAALWLLALPLAFAFIFGSAFRGGGPQGTWIPVVDLDRGDLSALFIEQLREDGYYLEVVGAERQQELKTKWPYGVVVPSGFGEKILKGERVQLTVVKGSGSPERVLEVQSRLTHAIIRFTKGLAMADTSHREWNDTSKSALKENLARPSLLTVARKSHGSLKPPPSGFYLSLPGILAMFVLQMILIYGGTTLVMDRTQKRLSRLAAAPVRAFEVYAGKVLARVLMALLQAALLLVCGSLLFKVGLGEHPWFLAPVIVCYAVFAGALSIWAGIVCRTDKQVVQIAIFAAMFLSALGGSWWPIEIVPDFFKTVALFTPTYWGVHGIQNVMYFNKSWEVLTVECPILLGFALVCLLLAVPSAKQLRLGRT